MNPFLKQLLHLNTDEEQQPEESSFSTCEGGEFVDDALRMEDESPIANEKTD